jgi:hypothetical protein
MNQARFSIFNSRNSSAVKTIREDKIVEEVMEVTRASGVASRGSKNSAINQ